MPESATLALLHTAASWQMRSAAAEASAWEGMRPQAQHLLHPCPGRVDRHSVAWQSIHMRLDAPLHLR